MLVSYTSAEQAVQGPPQSTAALNRTAAARRTRFRSGCSGHVRTTPRRAHTRALGRAHSERSEGTHDAKTARAARRSCCSLIPTEKGCSLAALGLSGMLPGTLGCTWRMRLDRSACRAMCLALVATHMPARISARHLLPDSNWPREREGRGWREKQKCAEKERYRESWCAFVCGV